MITAQNLSHYIIDMCTRDNKPVSNLQLQKMLYFIQTAYCKATNGDLLFSDEFQAWPYGPVISSVYEEYSYFGGRVIEKQYNDISNIFSSISAAVKDFVDDAIRTLRDKYPWDLVQLSHAKGSPWSLTYNEGEGHKAPISNNLIRQSALA